MASDMHSTVASKFVRIFMNTLRNFIKLGPAIIQPPPHQILGKARMYLDGILPVGILGLDWVRAVCQSGSEIHDPICEIDGSSKGDSDYLFRFGRKNGMDTFNFRKLKKTQRIRARTSIEDP